MRERDGLNLPLCEEGVGTGTWRKAWIGWRRSLHWLWIQQLVLVGEQGSCDGVAVGVSAG